MYLPTTAGPLWSAQAHIPSIVGRQLVITDAQGSYLMTTDGQRLFDGTAGLWHTNIGHGREEIAQVAYKQIKKLETYHVFGRYLNDRAVELSEVLVEMSPIRDAKVILNSGGSDSIDVACKLARRHWQREGRSSKTVILSREFSYHGLHAYGTSISGLEFNREGYGTESLVHETARVSYFDIKAVETEIRRIGPENIAAISAEPIMGTGGVLPPQPGYLIGLQRLAREHEILLIADEVITGFGRSGWMFASERYGIQPDMITMAKGITSGYAPLGGVLVAPHIWEPFFTAGDNTPIYRHGTTYSGHATSCAIAVKNLEILEREGLVKRAGELEKLLAAELDDLASHDLVVEIRVAGFLGGLALSDEITAEEVTDRLLELGFVARPLRGNTVQISPPFITTDDELRQLVGAIRKVLDETH